jgi:hypothetical protein
LSQKQVEMVELVILRKQIWKFYFSASIVVWISWFSSVAKICHILFFQSLNSLEKLNFKKVCLAIDSCMLKFAHSLKIFSSKVWVWKYVCCKIWLKEFNWHSWICSFSAGWIGWFKKIVHKVCVAEAGWIGWFKKISLNHFLKFCYGRPGISRQYISVL